MCDVIHYVQYTMYDVRCARFDVRCTTLCTMCDVIHYLRCAMCYIMYEVQCLIYDVKLFAQLATAVNKSIKKNSACDSVCKRYSP